MVRMKEVTSLSNRFLTLCQYRGLSSDLRQLTYNCFVAVNEAHQCVWNIDVVAKLLDQLLRRTKVVTRNARVEMVDGLKLQTTMEEVEPLRTVYIHGGAQHLLCEGLLWPMVHRAHGKVGKRNLYMKRHGHYVADHDVHKTIPVGRNRLVDDQVAKPVPEKYLSNAFKPPRPSSWPLSWSLPSNKEDPGLHVEVEAAKAENWVVQI